MASIYITRLDTSRKEIRLFELLPAESLQDPIQCRLYTTQLSIETEYTALSYVWGDPTTTSPITVNGLSFQATQNLCAALRSVRSKSNLPTTLWVDAICINQSDNDEKSSQVQLMRDIYHNASLVTVWLGESDKYSSEAIVLIKLTVSLLKCAGEKGEKRYPADYISSVVTSAVFKNDSRFVALLEFFSRPWWNRVWVVQEVVVSRRAKMICGTTEILWDDLQLAFDFWVLLGCMPDDYGYELERRKLDYALGRTKVAAFLSLFMKRDQHDQAVQDGVRSFPGLNILDGVGSELEATIIAGCSFKSTDPRDKVYAWLGLFERDGFALVPDYNASTAQVYVNALKTVMELTGSLSLVALSGGLDHSQGRIPGLPSWAPDFRHDDQWGPFVGHFMSHRASASEMARATISPDGKVLRAETFVVDYIQLTDAGKDEQEGWKLDEKLCRWMYLVLQHRTHLHTSAAMDSNAGKLLSKDFFAAVVWPRQFSLPRNTGVFLTRSSRSKYGPFIEKLWAGFMAHSGYWDRLQDIAQLCKKHQPHYYDKLQPHHQSTHPVYHNLMASVRPGNSRICCSSGSNPLPPLPYPHDEENIKRFCRLWGLPEDEKPLYFEYETQTADNLTCNKQNTMDTDALWFAQRAGEYTAYKTLFITDLGLLGSGPQNVRPGDSLAIIRGCRVPFVIRKHSNGDGSFEVLGQCYVRALMDGKYVQNLRSEGKLKWEKLSFR